MSQMNRAVHGSSFSGLREEEILSCARLRLEGRLKTRKMETRMNSLPRALDRRLTVLLAVAVFAGAGTIHYQTPMLAAFAAEFHADAAAAGLVATLTFGGFLAGTIFFVPLGDRFDKRRVILAQLAVLIPALLAMAAASSAPPPASPRSSSRSPPRSRRPRSAGG